ncbi:MAG: HD domain-containing protein [Thermodesulfobacteriota bacterium]|nr:HD domain-containing protein [Thermodesulfobacteriota bacterium]
MEFWNSALLVLLFALLLVVIVVLYLGQQKEKVVRVVTLRNLSKLWEKEGRKEIHISELSPLWREIKYREDDDVTFDFEDLRATALMEKIDNWGWFKKCSLQRNACGHILSLLDKESDCPSVVNIHGDVEGGWDENTFQILSRTTLLHHSINVAEQVVQLHSANEAWHVIPDTMVAALGHDLGKLKSIRGYLYSLGEHPVASARPLSGIDAFNQLPRKDEILQAIKFHHKMPKGLLGKTLKKADQLARQKELEENSLAFKNEVEQRKGIYKNRGTATWQAQEDIFGKTGGVSEKKSKSEAPESMDISTWFDAAQFLEKLKPHINKMYGRQFFAFSMSNGYVYFQVKVLEDIAREQAEKAGCMEIATMAKRDTSMRNVLFTIVHQLRTEHEVIASGLIKKEFFGGYFLVTRKIGKPMKGFYTPFHAEAFGSIAEMEQAKPKILKDIVKVSPYTE